MTVKELRKVLGALVDAEADAAGYEVLLDFNGVEDLADVEVRDIVKIEKKPGVDRPVEVQVRRVVLSA